MEGYHSDIAVAFVRGKLRNRHATIEDGIAAGLRLHKFKRDAELPRVQRVVSMLRGLVPQNLLDIGCGRGTLLWPLLAAFPELPVTAVDVSEIRSADAGAVRLGGIERLNAVRMDVQRPAFQDASFDVITMLEVLEHLEDPQLALRCVVAMARRFVLLSVPSVKDDNPEHRHLFRVDQLERMAAEAGSVRTKIGHVLNHRVVLMCVSR